MNSPFGWGKARKSSRKSWRKGDNECCAPPALFSPFSSQQNLFTGLNQVAVSGRSTVVSLTHSRDSLAHHKAKSFHTVLTYQQLSYLFKILHYSFEFLVSSMKIRKRCFHRRQVSLQLQRIGISNKNIQMECSLLFCERLHFLRPKSNLGCASRNPPQGKHCVTLVFHNREMHYCTSTGSESFPLFWDVRHATLIRGNTA